MGWGLDRSCVSRHRMQDRCANLYQSWSPGICWGWKTKRSLATLIFEYFAQIPFVHSSSSSVVEVVFCLSSELVRSVNTFQWSKWLKVLFILLILGAIGNFVTPNNYILDLYVYLLCNENLFSPHHRRRGRVSSFKASLTFLWGETWLTEKLRNNQQNLTWSWWGGRGGRCWSKCAVPGKIFLRKKFLGTKNFSLFLSNEATLSQKGFLHQKVNGLNYHLLPRYLLSTTCWGCQGRSLRERSQSWYESRVESVTWDWIITIMAIVGVAWVP